MQYNSSFSGISFQFQSRILLKERNKLKEFLFSVAKKEGFLIRELHFLFCSDARISEINKQYLYHDYFTDIITFDLKENASKNIIADIFISCDTVKKNAILYKVPLHQELHRVIFHGLLHLIGFDDKTPAQKKRMRDKEDALLKEYL